MNRIDQLADQLIKSRRHDGQRIVRVDDAEEGVALARRLLEMSEAQWFRGQVVNYPKLAPSVYRPDVDQARAKAALNRFIHWVKATPGMEEIAASTDAMIAIAQHYGMPTTFIDFTTEPSVAGYFASASTKPKPFGIESCIFCLNTGKADSVWSVRPGTDPERLVLDVANLWRLEAQHGVFVWCGYDDLNGPFPLDRIVFPYAGTVSSPTDADIYPTRESSLEARLREYFQAEAMLQESAVFVEIQRHVPMHTLTFDEPEVRPEYFIAPPARHESWTDVNVAGWLVVARDVWTDVQRAPSLLLSTTLGGEPDKEADRCETAVLTALQSDAMLRNSAAALRVDVSDGDAKTTEELRKTLQRVWDAMARLPWTDEQLALTVAQTLRLFLEAHRLRSDGGQISREVERATMTRVLAKPIRVELGGQENIHTWAWVDERDLLAAVRPDFDAILRPEKRQGVVGNSFNTMMVSRSPSTLFEFSKLSALFARQMIPTQAVFYPEHPMFATPARVNVIGPE